MSILALILLLTASLPGGWLAAHETFRVIGPVTRVSAKKLDVRNKDGRTLSMELTQRTVIRRLKEEQKLPATALKVGQSVVVDAFNPYAVDEFDDSDLEALDIRIVPPLGSPSHPGHGEPVLLAGTVTAIEAKRVQIETLDRASASLKKVWVIVDDKTVVRAGKNRLTVAELHVGQKVDFAGETDLGPNDEPLVRAITFRLPSK